MLISLIYDDACFAPIYRPATLLRQIYRSLSNLTLIPTVKAIPDRNVWLAYDEAADVLYINFRKPSVAADSELTDDDVIVRYAGEEVVGLTVLHASRRDIDTQYPN